ncbi:branched-chain amino acid ABC transporter permease [Aeromicrobium choanae]|uniref:Amino acid/amide ABC transporter membrane protein 1, HAAT family n=1 Tax=Aeromicrobium choanae TaxID=1736691 RepID=A0A1T4YWG5_9ACTN|nr:branched-chain amino acid ABC transporter permease [Aeromicrobium choanae]SKB06120.1 amino acid/amide ABC transporter membrane protein 1, HAAT family [Aeromicrobium choanae]
MVFAQAVWGSIVTGALYGLVGVGFVLLFRASKVLSFCQGAFMLLGAFIFYDLVKRHELPFTVATLITVSVVAVLSALVYLACFARIAAREPFATSVATIGLAGVLQAIVAVRYGTSPLALPDVVGTTSFKVAGATITVADLVSVAMTLIVVSVLLLVLAKTQLGLQMNAVADNPGLSVHLGVSAARIATIAWGLAGLTAAFAGIAFALRASVDPVGVANIGFFAFPAIILGGLDSVPGALVGGLVLGTLQNFVAAAFGAEWVDLIAFSMMLAFLMVRPTGLFGKAEVVRL